VYLNGTDFKMYDDYVKELVNYNIKLPDVSNPFIVVKKPKKVVKKKKQIKTPVRFVEKTVTLLAVFNQRVLLRIDGNNEKWLKVGEKLDDYKLVKIIDNKSVLVVDKNNKKKLLAIQSKSNFKIKVR
jgi:hypothetical protein